ncbi:MAG: DUF5652 family protein [bacterium]
MLRLAPQIFSGVSMDTQTTLLILFVTLWVIPWKAVALWKAARNDHKGWFVVLILLNTLAVLEAVYIFMFSNKHKKAKVALEPMACCGQECKCEEEIKTAELKMSVPKKASTSTRVKKKAVSKKKPVVKKKVADGPKKKKVVAKKK